jgi:replicative DNA helicase
MTNDTSAMMAMPYDLRAEKAVIGSALIDPDAYDRAAGMGLTAKDFYREGNAVIWQAMEYLAARGEPVNDFILVTNEIESAGDLDTLGSVAYLTECAADTPSSIYIDHYAKIVIAASLRRRIIGAGSDIVKLAYEATNEGDPAVLLDAAMQKFIDISAESSAGFKPVSQVLPGALNQIELGNTTGIMTGYGMLDRIMGGLRPGELSILAGRPAMGKSGLAQCIVNNICKRGKNVALVNLEMSSEETTNRILSQESSVPLTTIRRGGEYVAEDEWVALLAAASVISEFGLFLLDKPSVSVSQLRGICRGLQRSYGLDMVVIDYLQLLTTGKKMGGDENRQQEVSYIARSLKILARELGVPVMALAQLSRAVESRADKRPMLSDLRESGEIEQAADSVLFIYRDDYYNENSERQNIADVIVAKNRNDGTGSAPLYFRKELTVFRDLEVTRETLEY